MNSVYLRKKKWQSHFILIQITSHIPKDMTIYGKIADYHENQLSLVLGSTEHNHGMKVIAQQIVTVRSPQW